MATVDQLRTIRLCDEIELKKFKKEDRMEKCNICGHNKLNYKCIEEDTFIGTYNVKVPKEFLRRREHDMGFDYYAKEDFLEITCDRCGKINYKHAGE